MKTEKYMFVRTLTFPFLICLFFAGAEVFAQTPITPGTIPSHSISIPSTTGTFYVLNPGNYTATDTTQTSPQTLFVDTFVIGGNTTVTVSGTTGTADQAGLSISDNGTGTSYPTFLLDSARYFSSAVNSGSFKVFGTYVDGTMETYDTNLNVRADGTDATGLFVTSKLTLTDSNTIATATNGATGIALGYVGAAGFLTVDGGRLTLGAGDGTAVGSTSVNNVAVFTNDSTVAVQVDADNPALFGKMNFNNITIEDGAKVSVNVLHSRNWNLGDSKTFDYLTSVGKTGDFTADASLKNYELGLSADGKQLTVTRIRTTAEGLDGPNYNLASGLELGIPGNETEPGYEAVNDLFNYIDNQSFEGANDAARRSSGWQIGKFSQIMLDNTDFRQNNMFNQLTQIRTAGQYNALAEGVQLGQANGANVNPWTRWVSWDGNSQHFGGETPSFGGIRSNSSAFNVGMARKILGFGRRTFAGLNFTYNYGKFRDVKDSRDAGYTLGRFDGFTILASARVDKAYRTYWTDWNLGWSVNSFDMNRRDYLGGVHHSETTAGLFRLGWAIGKDYAFQSHKNYFYYEHNRLSPILGLDYSVLSQAGLTENNNNGLALRGGSDWMNSLRGKLGLEYAYRYTDVAFTMHSYLRYEFIDRGMDFPMSFATAPAVNYVLSEQPVDRVSGVIGFDLTCQLFENQDVGISYDGIFIDGGSSHWFDLRYVRRF